MAVYVVGGGLAGCEAAWQAAKRGVNVKLYEMKPERFSPAHRSESLAELVCSNSFKATGIENASGLLKEEMRVLGGLIISCADAAAVPAGGALAVDREAFSRSVSQKICDCDNIEVIRREVRSIDELMHENGDCECVIIAAGPLMTDSLSESIVKAFGARKLHFFDAAAPVILRESIDETKVFKAARYGKGSADYINCPMRKEEYKAFYRELIKAERADAESFDSLDLYEGCMPVEEMAARGEDTIRFGPLKPVGLRHPETGEEFYAVVQLRQDDNAGKMYNMVGFQTRLKFGEQKRVFGMIPGLENAEFVRFGVMHRNSYIQSPGILDSSYRVRNGKNPFPVPVYFAGQITGVEGYMESTSSGLTAGINAAREIKGETPVHFTRATQTGALASYVSEYAGNDFQPMGANFGIMDTDAAGLTDERGRPVRDKRSKRRYISERSLEIIKKSCKM